MSYVLKAKNKNISVPLDSPEELWSLKEFDPKLPLVMVITGWTTNFNDTENPTLDKIYDAYRCRGNVNFVVVAQFFFSFGHFSLAFCFAFKLNSFFLVFFFSFISVLTVYFAYGNLHSFTQNLPFCFLSFFPYFSRFGVLFLFE